MLLLQYPLIIQYLISCVPTPCIYYYFYGNVVFDVFIPALFTLSSEHDMLNKVPKFKDFYKFSLCSETIVSMCLVAVILMTIEPGIPLVLEYIFNIENNTDAQHLFLIKRLC